MFEKEKTIIELVRELQQCTLEEYEQIKYILLSEVRNKPNLLSFIHKVCELVEASRPKLIEMKR